MDEPDWCTMGYHSNGYGAECKLCETVVELTFGEDEKELLTIKRRDEVDQDELFAFVFYWTLEKLRRECDCTEQEREDYEPPFGLRPRAKGLNTQSA